MISWIDKIGGWCSRLVTKMLTIGDNWLQLLTYWHILRFFRILAAWMIRCWSSSSRVHCRGGPRPNTFWHCWTQTNFVFEQDSFTVPDGHSAGFEWPWKLFKILIAKPLRTLFVAPTAKIWNAKKNRIIWTFILTFFDSYLWFLFFEFWFFDG